MRQSVTRWIGNMKNNKPLNIITINNTIYYPIYEFDGKYYIKESGDVVFSTVYKRDLKTQINSDGYYYNNLMFNGVQTKRFYHRLIADSLLLRKDNRDIINHKNSNRKDNRIKNLEWVYRYENYYHGVGEENYKHEENTNHRLLTDNEIKYIYTSDKTRSELIKDIPKLTRRTHHDIKHDISYTDVTRTLVKGLSKDVKHKEKLDNIDDSTIYNIWLKGYIDKNLSLRGLEREYGLGSAFLKRKFIDMKLPLKSTGRYGKTTISL